MDERIAKLCREAIADQTFPGCVVGYIRDGKTAIIPAGRFTYDAGSPEVTAESVYDVASVTKSVPTNAIILRLIEDGQLSLDDKVVTYLPEFQNAYRDQMLVRHLLTYTVVLALHRGLSDMVREGGGKTLMKTLFAAPLQAPPGEQYFYTNAPAIFLGMIAERITGKQLDVLADEMFFEGLGMTRTTFHGEEFGKYDVAPTEKNFRGLVQGQPHDEAAWALRQAGVIAGNAGLFSTTGDLLKFVAMLLNGGEADGRRYFKRSTVEQMSTNQIPQLDTSVGLGWETEWARMAGRPGSDQMFGKTGFTGCAVVVNPVTKTALAYLANRTFPHRPPSRKPIQAFREALMDEVFAGQPLDLHNERLGDGFKGGQQSAEAWVDSFVVFHGLEPGDFDRPRLGRYPEVHAAVSRDIDLAFKGVQGHGLHDSA